MARCVLETRDLVISFGDNEAGENRLAGMNGVRIRHRRKGSDLFAPGLAGLNFELIFDGRENDRDLNFEPRRVPCALEPLPDGRGVRLTWSPTPHWGLEARILLRAVEPDMVDAEYAFIPTRRSGGGDLLGVFFADYINQPAQPGYRFFGRGADEGQEQVIYYASPRHGEASTHRAAGESAPLPMLADTHWLYSSFSPHVFTRPYFWGEAQGLTALWMFDPPQGLRLAHSPTGGGEGNPAWDYMFLMPGYEVGRTYRWRSRLVVCAPALSEAKVEALYRAWLKVKEESWADGRR